MKNQTKIVKIVLTGVFIALGIILPFLTGQIQGIGNKLLPMHIPVLLCGFVCGGYYGMAAGFIVPVLRSLLYGMPPMFPVAASMAFELCIYGLVTGILYRKLPKKNWSVYAALIIAMIAGRIVGGIANMILYGIQGNAYSIQMFMAGMFLNALPGIVLQLVLIPVIIVLLQRAKVIEKD